jgi:hypothetical protein
MDDKILPATLALVVLMFVALLRQWVRGRR